MASVISRWAKQLWCFYTQAEAKILIKEAIHLELKKLKLMK
jgi:hypothetical protein